MVRAGTVACLSENELAEFLENCLPPEGRLRVEHELDNCADCRALLCEWARLTQSTSPHEVRLENDSEAPEVGRLEQFVYVGAGGMGVVFSAYDPELDRRVAVKCLPSEGGKEAMISLHSEAVAMAKLRNGNVVSVYDVVRSEHHVFIVMELIDGQDLRSWLEETRSERAIVSVFLAVASGLIAVHEAGLVHGDIKPANIFLDKDGTAKLGDFGLAKAVASAATKRSARGTPAYMAPEQLRGGVSTQLSDQFSFCMSLYESLTGERALTMSILASDTEAAIALHKVSNRRLRRVLARGLATEPAQRYSDLAELTLELQATQRRRLSRLIAVGALGAALVGGGVTYAIVDELAAVSCAPSDTVSELWNDAIADEVEAAFVTKGIPYAAERSKPLRALMDNYVADWQSQHLSSCEATLVDHSQTERLHDLRLFCLNQREAELRAVVDILRGADSELLSQWSKITAPLRATSACSAESSLTLEAPPEDAGLRARVIEGMEEMTRTEVSLLAGHHDEAKAQLDLLADKFTSLGYDSLSARVMHTRARFQAWNGDFEASAQDHRAALQLAGRAQDHALVAAIWASQAEVNGLALGKRALAEEQLIAADIAAEAGRDDNARVKNLIVRGRLASSISKSEEAVTHFEAALVIAGGVEIEQITLAELYEAFAEALVSQRELERAVEFTNKAIAIYEHLYGRFHNNTALAVMILGRIALKRGLLEEALVHYQEAETVLEGVAASRSNYGVLLGNLAHIHEELGDLAKALSHQHRAVEIQRSLPVTINRVVAEYRLGSLLTEAKQNNDAQQMLTGARELAKKTIGDKHPLYGDILVAQSTTFTNAKDYEQAEATLIEARDSYHPKDASNRAGVEAELGFLAQLQGHHKEAEPRFRKALSLYGERPTPGTSLGLAKTLIALGNETEADQLLTHTLAGLEQREEATLSVQHRKGRAFFLQAQILMKRGRKADAVKLAKRAAELVVEDPEQKDEIAEWLSAQH